MLEQQRIRLSKSCDDCTFEEQEKCLEAFNKSDKEYFIHCNTSDFKLLKDLGI